MASSRFALLVLTVLAAGCAPATPKPNEPVATPVIELDEPVDAPAKKPTAKSESMVNQAKIADDEQRELNRKIAESAGVLGALRDAGELDGVFGGVEGDDSALGSLTGSSIGESFGAGGLGLGGTGRGGGGTGTGTIGLGTIGRGSGGGAGYGSGSGRAGNSRVTTGTSQVSGKLDKHIIQRIIRRNIAQVRYCYERALTKKPKLDGKVVTKFVIGPTGSVTSTVIKTGMDPEVDSCVRRTFMRMRFPKPDGGGIVTVTYPFVFQQAADASNKPMPAKPTKTAPP